MRPALIVLLALCAGLLPVPAAAQRLLTLDWTVAETLVALGHPPAGVAQVADYHSWIGEPRLPASTIDLGLRNQPSMELMAALRPDAVLITPMFAGMQARLSRIAPVVSLPLHAPDDAPWARLEAATRALGAMTGREAAAEALIDGTAAALARTGRRLRDSGRDADALLIVQLADERHVRVYAGNSLYQQVLDRLGLRNAWTGPVNDWGYRLLGLHELAGLEGRVVIVRPAPLGTLQRLQRNTLWQRLPIANRHPPIVLPPVWSLGGLPSARRFADLLDRALPPP